MIRKGALESELVEEHQLGVAKVPIEKVSHNDDDDQE
jgi:hypothetical protein